MKLVYKKTESDRIAWAQEPFRVECNSVDIAIEIGRGRFRFLKVFITFCFAFIDVSIIRMRDQNIDDYTRMHERRRPNLSVLATQCQMTISSKGCPSV